MASLGPTRTRPFNEREYNIEQKDEKITLNSLAPSDSSRTFSDIKSIDPGLRVPSAITHDALRPTQTQKDFEINSPQFNEEEIKNFWHSKTTGLTKKFEEEPNLRPYSGSFSKTKKNIVEQNKISASSIQKKKTRPNAFDKMTEKDKTDAYFRLQEENIQLKKNHTELEKSLKMMKNNFTKLEKGVKVEREMAENYTGKDFKSSMIESNLSAEALKSENKLLMKENKILIKAALTGNLNKQLLSRLEGPSLNKFNLKPRVLSGAVIFDIKRDSHTPVRTHSPQPVKDEYYKIEYERLLDEYQDLQSFLKTKETKIIELETQVKSHGSDNNSQEIFELREKCRILERQLTEALQSPFIKEDSKLKTFQSEINITREKALKLETQSISLQEQIRLLMIERDKYKEDYLVLSGKMQAKENYMNEFETQLRNIGGMDINAFMKALGLMKLRGEEPAWSQLDFLEQGTRIPNDLKGLQREVERLKLEKGQLAAEVEKAQSLLTLKNEMEVEKNALYESEIEQLKIQNKSALQRTEELARLADFRANRVIQLERNQRLNIYDEDNRIVGTKTQITVGELQNSAPEFIESGTEVGNNENILDLWLGEAEFYQTALEQTLRGQVSVYSNFVTFLTVDFYNMETQTTSLCDSIKPQYNIHISFKVSVNDFFIK